MKLLIIIFFLFFKFFTTSVLSENQNDPVELLNEKQKGLYYGANNCVGDDCLYFFSEFLKSIENDKNLKETWLYGWFTYWYGDVLHNLNQTTEAIEIWEKILSDEHFKEGPNKTYRTNSLIALGWIYYTDLKYLDDEKSFNFMKEAAENGNGWALNNLGVFYEMGRNTKKNMEKAFLNYKKASEKGIHWAYANLANFYILGEGNVEKDYQKALFLLKFSTIAENSVNDNFRIKTLLRYGKNPKNKKEFENWMIDTLLSTKDVNGFQELAWEIDNIEEKFKWHFLASKKSKNPDIKTRSIQEYKIIEKKYLSLNESLKLKKDAEKWFEKNWK